jgi:hypothetical protein
MKLIAHRKNTIQELIATPTKYGIEVDIRSEGDKLIIHHDPFVKGELFEEWLSHYQHGTLILNVKEDGLEPRLLALMKAHKIQDFFFLDQPFPTLIKCCRLGESRCAIRVSEFETIETALTLAGKMKWIWVDCFTHFPLSQHDAQRLKKVGFQLCLVSPELQGRPAESEIPELIAVLKERDIQPDAVCTKRPDLWEADCS